MRQGRLAVAAAIALGAMLVGTSTGHAQGRFNKVNGTGLNPPTFDPTSSFNTVNNDGLCDTTTLGHLAMFNTINNGADSCDNTEITDSSFNTVNNNGDPLASGDLAGHNTTVIDGGSNFNRVTYTTDAGRVVTSLTNGSSFNSVTQNGGKFSGTPGAFLNKSSHNTVTLGTPGNFDQDSATLTNSNFNTVTVACDSFNAPSSSVNCDLARGVVQDSTVSNATLTNASFSTIHAYGAHNTATIQNGAFDAINIGSVTSPVANDTVTITGSFDTVNDPFSNTNVVVLGNDIIIDCTSAVAGIVTYMTPGTISGPC
jgi:hypothetical protein